MTLPNTFANLTTAQMAYLDQNFAAVGALTTIACAVVGTDALVMTPRASAPTVPGYANNMLFSGIAAATNANPMHAAVAGLASLPIYLDTVQGPVPTPAGTVVAGNAFTLMYDSTLASGAGGFHIFDGLSVDPNPRGESSTVTAAAGTTLTASQITGAGTCQAIIEREGSPSGDYNDTTDTAAAIIGMLFQPADSTVIRMRVVNTSGHVQTLLGGTGVVIRGTATTANNVTHDFIGIVTQVTPTPGMVIWG